MLTPGSKRNKSPRILVTQPPRDTEVNADVTLPEVNEDSPDLTVLITPGVDNTIRNNNEDIYSPQPNLPRSRLQFQTDPMDNSRNSSGPSSSGGIGNNDTVNFGNTPPAQSVPTSVPRLNGLRPCLASSTLPSNKYSTVSLNYLMKEDVCIRNKYIVLQLLKIMSGSSSSTNNGQAKYSYYSQKNKHKQEECYSRMYLFRVVNPERINHHQQGSVVYVIESKGVNDRIWARQPTLRDTVVTHSLL